MFENENGHNIPIIDLSSHHLGSIHGCGGFDSTSRESTNDEKPTILFMNITMGLYAVFLATGRTI